MKDERKILYVVLIAVAIFVLYYAYRRYEGYCGTLSQAGFCKCTNSPVDFISHPKDNPMWTPEDKDQPVGHGHVDFYPYTRKLERDQMFDSLRGDYYGVNCEKEHALDCGYECGAIE